MSAALVCWKCGTSLKGIPLPLSRRAECAACEAELHVCRMCQFYDARVRDQCTEDRAEEVREKERANFCDYFKPRPGAYVAYDGTKAQAAKARLGDLFGATSDEDESGAPADAVREKLEQYLGSGGKKNKQ